MSARADEFTAPPAAWTVPRHDARELLSVAGIIQTPEIDKLAAAMAKFQGAVTGASKGGHAVDTFKTKDGREVRKEREYTRLADAWESARAPLAANGLAVMQWPTVDPSGDRVTVITRVLHESGQWMQASFSIAVDKGARMNPSQQYGSACTYAARYSFLAALGLPPSDDDAESAGERPADGGQRKRASKGAAPKSAPQPEPQPTSKVSAPASAFGTVMDWRTKIRTATDESSLKRVWTAFWAVREHFSAEQIADLTSTKDRRKAALADEATHGRCTHDDEPDRDPDGNKVCPACDALLEPASPAQQALGADDLPEGFGP